MECIPQLRKGFHLSTWANWTNRTTIHKCVIVISILALLASLWYAVYVYCQRQTDIKYNPLFMYIVLAIWTLIPPMYFWFDWECLCKDIPKDERDQAVARVTHTHELARNVWLALVIVLAYAFGIKWPP